MKKTIIMMTIIGYRGCSEGGMMLTTTKNNLMMNWTIAEYMLVAARIFQRQED